MDLSDKQKTTVIKWVQEGSSLAEIQCLLREKFDIPLTYMDVRFLVDDLELVMSEPMSNLEPSVDAKMEKAQDDLAEEDTLSDPEIVDDVMSDSVVVDVDAIMRPGSLVSGTVLFSDGVSLAWQLSASGQLGLIPSEDSDYRPRPEDVQSFQTQLQEVLRKKGY